jgi:hypothetical protein
MCSTIAVPSEQAARQVPRRQKKGPVPRGEQHGPFVVARHSSSLALSGHRPAV